jgi:AraC-like DNA-binding protein
MYQLSQPAAELRPYIEHYWHLHAQPDAPCDLSVDVFVDLRADLILNFGVPYARTTIGGETQWLSHSNLDGQRLSPIRIVQRGLVQVAGVRFRVGGLMPFVVQTVDTYTDCVASLDEAFGSAGAALERSLRDGVGDAVAQAAALDAFFLSRQQRSADEAVVHALLAHVDDTAGRVTVAALGRYAGRSVRTIDRLFRRHIGVAPKTYAQIARFQRCLSRLTREPGVTLSQVAVEGGYYDQSHLVRDYRRFAGTAPAAHAGYFPDDAPQDFRPNLVRFVQDEGPR